MITIGWDYLTLSSWLPFDDDLIAVASGGDSGDSSRRMQYRGNGGDCWFVGESKQMSGALGEDCAHFILTVSGERADQMRAHRPGLQGTATRLDIQVTAQCPEDFDLHKWGTKLLNSEYGAFRRRGRYPLVKIIASTSTTVYIGKRGSTSGRMYRVYEKWLDGTRYIRFEVEYSGTMAGLMAQHRGVNDCPQALMSEWYTLPIDAAQEARFITKELQRYVNGEQYAREVKERSVSSTYEWLVRSLQVGYTLGMNHRERNHLVDELRRLVVYLDYAKE